MNFEIESGMLINKCLRAFYLKKQTFFTSTHKFIFYKYKSIFITNVGDAAFVNEQLGSSNFFLATVYSNVDVDTNEYSANDSENLGFYEIGDCFLIFFYIFLFCILQTNTFIKFF